MSTIKRITTWLKPVIGSVIFVAFAGFWNANMDVVQFRWDTSIHENMFDEQKCNPKVSWTNKWWTNPDTGEVEVGKEKFPGSSTVFVRFTDCWHFFQGLMITCFILGVIFYRRRNAKFWEYLIDFVLLYGAFTLTFSVFFGAILIRKDEDNSTERIVPLSYNLSSNKKTTSDGNFTYLGWIALGFGGLILLIELLQSLNVI